MEEYAGIDSLRKAKNLVSLTGRYVEDTMEAKINGEKAMLFVKQKEEDRKLRSKRRKELMKKQKEVEEKQKLEEENHEKELRQKYKQEVLERWEETQKKLEQHEKEREEFKKPTKLEYEYAHERIEKNYHEQILTPSLEQKKLKLENLRNFHKPINREELDEHDKNFLVTLKRKQNEKRIKREQEMKNHPDYNPKKFQSKFMKFTLDEQKEREVLEKEEEKRIKEKADKMDKYGKLVKEMHFPKVSEKKRAEMRLIKKSMELRGNPLKTNRSQKKMTATDTDNKRLYKNRNSSSQGNIDWKKFKNPMIPKEKSKPTPIIIDYLLKRRVKRDEKEQDLRDFGLEVHNPYHDWKSLVDKAINNEDYHDLIKERVRAIESSAKMTEDAAKITKDIDEEARANDMMISALEAKLSILKKL